MNQFHEAILSCMSEAVYVVDTEMNIIYANPAAEDLTGYSLSEAIGSRCRNIFCEASDRCQDNCPPKAAMKDRLPILNKEACTRTKNGEIKNTQISFSPFFGGDQCLGAVIVIKDVTEIRRAEETIKNQNAFLKLTIDSLPDPFYVIDAQNYLITIANKSVRTGAQGGLTCYANTHERSEPCSGDDHPCPLKEVIKTGKPCIVEHVHRGGDGERRHYEVHGYPIFDDSGNVVQMIEYSMDITERKTAVMERETLIAELRNAVNQVKTLSGLLPICSACKNIREDDGYWTQIESYISRYSDAEFTHGLCPDCAKKLYPGVYKEK